MRISRFGVFRPPLRLGNLGRFFYLMAAVKTRREDPMRIFAAICFSLLRQNLYYDIRITTQ